MRALSNLKGGETNRTVNSIAHIIKARINPWSSVYILVFPIEFWENQWFKSQELIAESKRCFLVSECFFDAISEHIFLHLGNLNYVKRISELGALKWLMEILSMA